MKADNLFDSVIGLMFSETTDKEDYEKMFYPILNVTLAECFLKNNILRISKEKEPLAEIPIIKDSDDEIPYEDEMTRMIMPYGVAANLYSEDDENGITNVYREKYMMLLAEIGLAGFREIGEEI